jgi:hypothetical protein
MKAFLLTLSAILIVAFSGCAKRNDDAGLQEQLNEYFQALLHGRQQITIEKMDPRFFPTVESKREAITLLNQSTGGFAYHSITNQTPYGYFEESNSVHYFVPYVANATFKGQTGTLKSYLLATRYNGSNTWYFVDIGTKDRQTLTNYYSNLPQDLPGASRESRK